MPHRTVTAIVGLKINAILLWMGPALVFLAGQVHDREVALQPIPIYESVPVGQAAPAGEGLAPTAGPAGLLMGISAILMWAGNFYINNRDKKQQYAQAEREAQWKREDQLAERKRLDEDLAGKMAGAARRADEAQRRADELAGQFRDAQARIDELEHGYRQVKVNKAAIGTAQGGVDALVGTLAEDHSLPTYPRPGAPEGTPPPTILIVEDDAHLCRIYAALFNGAGFRVSQASTAADAITLVDKGPHWVLLDLVLVDGSGTDVLRYIRSHRPGMRVAVMTAAGDPAALEEVNALGVERVFQKDGDMAALNGLVDFIAANARG